MTTFHMRGARVLFLIYDITDIETFERLETRWMVSLTKGIQMHGTHVVVVGNKKGIVDVNPSMRNVRQEVACEFAATYGAAVFEVSSKDDTAERVDGYNKGPCVGGVAEVFSIVSKSILQSTPLGVSLGVPPPFAPPFAPGQTLVMPPPFAPGQTLVMPPPSQDQF